MYVALDTSVNWCMVAWCAHRMCAEMVAMPRGTSHIMTNLCFKFTTSVDLDLDAHYN